MGPEGNQFKEQQAVRQTTQIVHQIYQLIDRVIQCKHTDKFGRRLVEPEQFPQNDARHFCPDAEG